ncbi:cellulose biosynthesis protein BcsR [Serratia sp. UGAL515B_01]|uniref:cellulose biosynthesis protein BcsR n=1 Tax=Serratia sp. UGAL515B_01 TaxID=2986763 RepID=UPI002952DC96|nr:cellulose biosynthesis protein BcsR [Serratia sp. UGAL515B_01]WON77079.1 cellulose biosynthesis protein BcsR [Serratia sp. UGAL515B_01]
MDNGKLASFHSKASLEIEDDLAALSRAFSLPNLCYVDISRQERLTQMMIRWPLLAELATKTGSR